MRTLTRFFVRLGWRLKWIGRLLTVNLLPKAGAFSDEREAKASVGSVHISRVFAMISPSGKSNHSTGSSPNCIRSFADESLLLVSLHDVDSVAMNQHFWPNAPSPSTSLNGRDRSAESPILETAQSPNNETVDASADCTASISLSSARNSIFSLSIRMGQLSAQFLQDRNWKDPTSIPEEVLATIATEMGHMVMILMELSGGLSIDLHVACMKKIQLNERKYPVELCKGKAGKYTEYSQHTGITKTIGQSTIHDDHVQETVPYQEPSFVDYAIPAIVERTRRFAVDRDWLQYHTPRNLALALMGEIGELAELFQFLGDDDTKPYSTEEQLDKIGQEIADITIYMCRLSDVCNISLPDAFRSLT